MGVWLLDPKGLFLDPLAVSPWKFFLSSLVVSAKAVSASSTHKATMPLKDCADGG